MLAATHFHLGLSVPAAALIAGWIVWYWRRLGRPDVPVSRRRIRRASMFLMVISLPMFVRALSVLDPKVDPRQYVATWMLAMAVVGLVILTAALDAINNLRLHRQLHEQEIRLAARELTRAAAHRRAGGITAGSGESASQGPAA